MTIPVKPDGGLLHNANRYQNLHRRIRWKYNQILTLYDEIRSLAAALDQEIIKQIDRDRIAQTPIPVGDNYWRLTFHFEAYLNAARSLMDLIAKLTRYAFPKPQPPISFSDQRNWFAEKMPDVDPDYKGYLATQLGWYDELKKLRDEVTHHTAIEVRFRTTEAELEIVASTGISRSAAELIDIREVCARIQDGMLEFLAFFDQHFAGRL